MAELGNAGLYFGLDIVGWVRKADGMFEHDFSRLERYLDLALEHHAQQRIKVVVLHAWVMGWEHAKPSLTAVDEQTGEAVSVAIPQYGTPECEALLAPALRGARDVLAKRGLGERLLLGTTFDNPPAPNEVAMLRRILPDARWYRVSHIDMKAFPYDENDPDKTVPVGCTSRIGRGGGTQLYERGRLLGLRTHFWKTDPGYMGLTWNRGGTAWFMNGSPEPWRFRNVVENAVVRNSRGVGNLCADAFGPPGERHHGLPTAQALRQRASSAPGFGVVTPDVLAPGPDGPVRSIRSLNMAEGVQETEARIAVQMALTDEAPPLPGAAACEYAVLLDARIQAMRTWDTLVEGSFWAGHIRRWTEFGAVGSRERNRRLFDMAAAVARAREGR